MKLKKGDLVLIEHCRKGNFFGRVKKDFDTEEEVFYPIISDEIRLIEGLNNDWENGEEIPCRNSLCKITKVADKQAKRKKKEGVGA